MSKIGRKIIILPEGVNISGEGQEVKVIGPKGELKLELPSKITLKKENNSLLLERHGDDRRSKSLHGLSRSLLANMVYGVSSGFQKKLDFKGVGFKAESQAQKLILNLGFSHPVEFPIPEGIEIKVAGERKVAVVKADAQSKKIILGNIGRLKKIKELCQRNYEVDEIRVR